MADLAPTTSSDDDAIAFAEGAITLWSNLLALIGTHLLDSGTPRQEVLTMLSALHDANESTIRSPRARAVANRHLMAVFRALAEA